MEARIDMYNIYIYIQTVISAISILPVLANVRLCDKHRLKRAQGFTWHKSGCGGRRVTFGIQQWWFLSIRGRSVARSFNIIIAQGAFTN